MVVWEGQHAARRAGAVRLDLSPHLLYAFVYALSTVETGRHGLLVARDLLLPYTFGQRKQVTCALATVWRVHMSKPLEQPLARGIRAAHRIARIASARLNNLLRGLLFHVCNSATCPQSE